MLTTRFTFNCVRVFTFICLCKRFCFCGKTDLFTSKWLLSSVGYNTAPASHRSWVRIPLKIFFQKKFFRCTYKTTDLFIDVCLVIRPLNEGEAGVDLVLIETSLLFLCIGSYKLMWTYSKIKLYCPLFKFTIVAAEMRNATICNYW